MIVSIAFRHGTEGKNYRSWIEKQCIKFKKYTNDITRIHVVFSKQSHKSKSDSVMCHISIHASGHRHVDIYECALNVDVAFNQAYHRACSELVRISTGRGEQHNKAVAHELYAVGMFNQLLYSQ